MYLLSLGGVLCYGRDVIPVVLGWNVFVLCSSCVLSVASLHLGYYTFLLDHRHFAPTVV
jgi:hypothetical protein